MDGRRRPSDDASPRLLSSRPGRTAPSDWTGSTAFFSFFFLLAIWKEMPFTASSGTRSHCDGMIGIGISVMGAIIVVRMLRRCMLQEFQEWELVLNV